MPKKKTIPEEEMPEVLQDAENQAEEMEEPEQTADALPDLSSEELSPEELETPMPDLLPLVPQKEVENLKAPTFYGLDFAELDRDLSPKEKQSWNSIYASYRARSVLTGTVVGTDEHTVIIQNKETGVGEKKIIPCAVVFVNRVKVLVPQTEMWSQSEECPNFVLRNMMGCEIDYVVIQVDRLGEVVIASRRMAITARRYYFSTQRELHHDGALTTCRLLAVGPRRILGECHGFDVNLTQRDIRYTAIADLREEYHPGQVLDCRIKHYNGAEGTLQISVKEVDQNPFVDADKRHPVASRRQAVIAGKYAGGVFCNLPDGTVCMCIYATHYQDAQFQIGDTVIIRISQYDYKKQQIYGKIVSQW